MLDEQQLNDHIANQDLIRIDRSFTEGDASMGGFLVKQSDEFLLLQREDEFRLNGFAIMLKDDVEEIRHSKYEHAQQNILEKEGVLDSDLGIDFDLDLSSWQTIFRDLKEQDYHVIAECEDLDEPSFNIGPIREVHSDRVSIHFFDATGLYEKEPTSIDYDDITTLQFGDRYTTVFRKYLRSE